jgi:triosephosphate isomerase (TIM)
MRRKIIAGNWKMNKSVDESAKLATEIVKSVSEKNIQCDVVICPSFLALDRVSSIVKGTSVLLGAQDVHWESQGAFTGKVSTDMLKALGVTYVILGHSEQRALFGETDATVRLKVGKVLAEGLKPIICVGESLQEREENRTEAVVATQVKAAYAGLTALQALETVIAYEPVWAIGTGRTASDEQAQAVHVFIRGLLKDQFGAEVANALRIQYGGSMKAENAKGLLGQADVDGGLIGGASLKADAFLGILTAA